MDFESTRPDPDMVVATVQGVAVHYEIEFGGIAGHSVWEYPSCPPRYAGPRPVARRLSWVDAMDFVRDRVADQVREEGLDPCARP
jgi:hypothetical protein